MYDYAVCLFDFFHPFSAIGWNGKSYFYVHIYKFRALSLRLEDDFNFAV